MMKTKIFLLIITLLALLSVSPALAQSVELDLRVSRNFGFSSGTGRVQGSFTMRVSGPSDLTRVEFLIDNQPMGEATQTPFSIRFNTDNYPLGEHTLSATGYTSAGQELKSNEYHLEFVSAQAGWQSASRIIIPILGLVVLMMLFGFVLPAITGRGKLASLPLGAARNYGASGGAICPKCHRPFSLHFFSLHLLMSKLERCPYCGKWSLVRRASLQDLRSAEAAELDGAQAGEFKSQKPEEELRKQLDDSRFQDS